MAYTDPVGATHPKRVTQAEFARIANVNKSTVFRWTKNGRISLGPDGKIDVEAALRERQASESPEPRHQARKAQFDEAKATSAPSGGESGGMVGLGVGEKLGLMLKQAHLKKITAQAEQANLDLDLAAKAVYSAEDVHYLLAELGHTIADSYQSLADRYTPVLVACKGDSNTLHKSLEEIGATELTAIHQNLTRKAEEAL